MQSTTVFQVLLALSFWSSSEALVRVELLINDGSEVRAQNVLDELRSATLARNKTAIADCLNKEFYWQGRGKGLNKDEFVDYLLRISKRTSPKGIINSAYISSPGYILTKADINFIKEGQQILFVPETGADGKYVQGGRDTIRNIRNEEMYYGTLNQTEKIVLDFLRSLYRGMSFKNKTEVLRHLTDDFSLVACRGSYDREYVANLYSSFHDRRLLTTTLVESEFIGNERELRANIRVQEPHHLAVVPRNDYFIYFNLILENGMYKLKSAEYKADCRWPGL